METSHLRWLHLLRVPLSELPIDFSMLLPRRAYYIGIGTLIVLFALTLFHRISHFDDAWCTEQSYWLLEDGIVRSELFRGYNYWHERLYVFHKAFVYMQAALLYFLGFSVWGARATPMLFTGVVLLLLLRYFRTKRESQLLATMLYIGCGTLWIFGIDNRPETMVAAFGLASFLLLTRNQQKSSIFQLIMAGVCAGMAALTHLNGLIFIVAGAGWLVLRRNWRAAFLFGFSGSCIASLYLADALADGQIDRLVYQFTHDHVTQANQHWNSKLRTMAEYHHIFFHSVGETFLTVLTIGIAFIIRWRLPNRVLLTPAAQYTLLLISSFWFLTKSNTAYYYLLFTPFLVILITEWSLSVTMSATRRIFIISLICLYPLGSVMRGYELIVENYTYPDQMSENALLAAHMPNHNTKVIAPISFFFGQMTKYRIRSLTYYSLLDANQYHGKLSLHSFFALAARDNVQYIVSDLRIRNQVYHIPVNAPYRIGNYHKTFQDEWHSIFELDL